MKYKCTVLVVDNEGHVIEHIDTALYDSENGGSDAAWSDAKRQIEELLGKRKENGNYDL